MQADLTNAWLALIAAIEQRDAELESAGEIHRFNRDIGEALSRIGEKEAILHTEDKGRDTKSAQALIRYSVISFKSKSNFKSIDP